MHIYSGDMLLVLSLSGLRLKEKYIFLLRNHKKQLTPPEVDHSYDFISFTEKLMVRLY